ncbi:homing endonuclease [Vibrio phage D148]
MNYARIYDELISNAQATTHEGYVEIHHIVPRCMGGTDESENLVALSAREHFLAHWLLAKIHSSNDSLTYAWNMMCVGRTQSSHLYKYAREEVSRKRTGKTWGNHTEEAKRKMSESRKGVKQGPRSDEAKEKMRQAKLGHTQSEETISRRTAKTKKPVVGVKDGVETRFDSIKDASLELDIDPSCITKVCKGKRRTYKGYVWKYAG